MTKKINKSGTKKVLLWFTVVFLIIFCYLAYYQFLYQPDRVNSNIFKLNRVLHAHSYDVWTVKFSPGGNLFASGGVDSTIKIWNKEDGKLILNLKHPSGVTYLDFGPDGNYIASAAYDSKVRLWKLPEGTLVKEFAGHKGTVWSVCFSPDGKTVASSGDDTSIKLWDIESGELKNTLSGHTLTVWDIKFNTDNKILASSSFDNTIKIWNIPDGKLLRTLAGHSEAVVALAFSHNGKKLASTSDDQAIKIWNTGDWSLMHTLEVPEHIQAADFSPDDKLLLTGGRDKPTIGEFLQNFLGDSELNKGVSMRLWNVESGKLLQTFSQHSNDVNDVAFCGDGKWIAAGSSDKTVSLWQLKR